MTVDRSLSLVGNFARTAAERAEAPAFTFVDAALRACSYTFERLFDRVGEIARPLARAALNPDLPVAILASREETQVLHYLAALTLGLTPAILAPPHRRLNRAYYLQTTRGIFGYARFSAVITDVHDLGVPMTALEPYTLKPLTEATPSRAESGASLKDAAFLQFSSGTTGIKRGVLVSDAAAVAQIATYADVVDLSTDDCIVSWLPLYHDMGLMTSLNMALAAGVHAVIINPIDWVADPSLYLRAVSRYGGTLSWHPNFAFAFMADRVREHDVSGIDLTSLRGLANCSEPVTKVSQDRFAGRFTRSGLNPAVFWGCYAMAETTFALTHGRSTDAGYEDGGEVRGIARRPDAPCLSVGRPLPGVDIRVIDDWEVARSERQLGELWVKSPFNATGYYNNAAATGATFTDGWYRTGDLGYRVGEDFYLCGRKKDLLIVGGVNIAPQDVEDVANEVEGIHPGRVAVFGAFDATRQTELVTILAETSAPATEHAEIAARVRQRVAAAFQISGFELALVPAGWLIKSSSGKMARSANREKWREQRAFLPI